MNTEYEVKILDIDVDSIKKTLDWLGVRYLWKVDQQRYVYDFNPVNPNKWLRLRKKWDKVELTMKEMSDDSITGTKELEIGVDSFEKTHALLWELWYFEKAYQENTRESYILDWVEIEIDSWPLIPSYLEIEWNSVEEVEKIVRKIWFSMTYTTSINTNKVYKKHGIDLDKIKILQF